jgi:toxin ParE1/3/4
LHEVRYYETVRTGTGRKFREAVDVAFEKIRRAPETGNAEELGCRRVRVKGFPFAIVFREQAQEIVVFAVRNDARRPGYWLERAS